MALTNSGRRTIRSEHEIAAGGDNLYHHQLSKARRQQNPPTLVESQMNVLDENRYFGGLIGNKEILMMMLIGVALYLINGQHAQTLCTLLTSIPPAVFSYRVLISQKTSKDGYHSIIFYWTVYGIMALIDQLCGTAQGYNLLKGGLLGAVFLHALRTNPSAIPKNWQIVDPATVEMLSTILTRVDSMGFVKRTASSGFVPQSPTITQFSEDEEQDYDPTTSIDIENEDDEHQDVSTACSFIPSLAMQTTQKMSSAYVMQTATPHSIPEVDEAVEPPSTIRFNYKKPQHEFESMSAMTVTCSGAIDIITVPADKVVFSREKREAMIQVTNVSPLHIMFALKTNADTYLIAAPTTGVLLSGQTMAMRVGVIDQYFEDVDEPGKSIDKLAIDYTSIPQSSRLTTFSAEFFQCHNRRRHAIRVFYH